MQVKALALSAKLFVLSVAIASSASGQQVLPTAATLFVGRWLVTSNEDPGNTSTGVAAEIQLYLEGQELRAQMLTVKEHGKPVHHTCDRCTGGRNRMPIVGSVFVWGLHWDGQKWANGEVLDVRDSVTQGIIAHCEIEMLNVDSVRIYGWLFHRWLGKGSKWTRLKP